MWWSVASDAPRASRSWALDSWGQPTTSTRTYEEIAVTRSARPAWRVRWASWLLGLKRSLALLVVTVLLVPMATAPWTV